MVGYHYRQTPDDPYKSTVLFSAFLKDRKFFSQTGNELCWDLGCGAGANTRYLSDEFRKVQFLGLDRDDELVGVANSSWANDNVSYLVGDIREVGGDAELRKPTHILAIQVLSFLPWYKTVIDCVARLKPTKVAFTTLSWDGPDDVYIKVVESLNKDTEKFFNHIIARANLIRYFSQIGYDETSFGELNVDVDLRGRDEKEWGTRTQKMDNGSWLQISGPLLMPWKMFEFSRRA
jgi:hypothetical protein